MLCALFVQFQRRYFLCTCVQKKNMLFCVQGGQIICLKVKLAFLFYKQIAQLWQSSPKIAKCSVDAHSCTMFICPFFTFCYTIRNGGFFFEENKSGNKIFQHEGLFAERFIKNQRTLSMRISNGRSKDERHFVRNFQI